MPIDPKLAELTSINEAIAALNYGSREEVPETDALTNEALEYLMAARERLTDKPYPEHRPRWEDTEAFEAWHTARAEEQRREGRQ